MRCSLNFSALFSQLMPDISSLGMSSRLPGWTSWGTPSPSTDATPSWTAPRHAPRYPLSQDMRMCPQSIWLPRVSTPERPSPRSRSCWQALLTRDSLVSRWIHRQQQTTKTRNIFTLVDVRKQVAHITHYKNRPYILKTSSHLLKTPPHPQSISGKGRRHSCSIGLEKRFLRMWLFGCCGVLLPPQWGPPLENQLWFDISSLWTGKYRTRSFSMKSLSTQYRNISM